MIIIIIISLMDPELEEYDQEQQYNYDDPYEYQTQSNPYQVIPLSNVFNQIKNLVETTSMMVALPFGWSLILLKQFKWQTDSLGEYFQNMKKYKKIIGYSQKFQSVEKVQNQLNNGDCVICCQNGKLIKNICGDSFCSTCWIGHINQHLNNMNPFMKCMNCQAPLLHELIKMITFDSPVPENKKIFQKYEKQICQFFTNTSKSYKCCPGVDCNYCIKCDNYAIMTVKCMCGKSFCFRCQSDDHSPCICEQKNKWTDIVLKEEANAKWIAQNTKLCPWCNKAVQRSQGCNFMACLCGKSFCYMCSKPWEPDHKDHFKCHIYKKRNDDEVSREKAVLEKLNFYAQKYLNTNGVVVALKKVDVFDRRRFLYEKLNIELAQSDFMEQAYKFAIQCCESLKWIYVYTYFVDILDENRKQRILFSQGQYESFKQQLLKKLSHDLKGYFTQVQKYLQKNKDQFESQIKKKEFVNQFNNLKSTIINYYKFTQQFKQKFVQQIETLDSNIIKRGVENTSSVEDNSKNKKTKKK